MNAATHIPLDVMRLRAEFPILQRQIRGKPLVYLDNAATTQKPQTVIDAITHCYSHSYGNIHRAVHTLAEEATRAFDLSRDTVQTFLNAAHSREIVFTGGATAALNLLARSFLKPRLQSGDVVVVSEMEHHANIVPWQLVGAELAPVRVDETGDLDLDHYERLLAGPVKLVALTHVSNTLGTINPIHLLIQMAHARGIPVVVDGSQAVPHLAVDVQALDCDFYVFSGHKLYGPNGIGVLYGKEQWLDAMPPDNGGGDMIDRVDFAETTYAALPNKFEAGTPPIVEAIALGAAIDWVNRWGLDAIAAHEQQLLQQAMAQALATPGLRVIGQAAHKAAVLSFVCDDAHPQDIGTLLDQYGIAVRTGHHCTQPLLRRYGVTSTARASFAAYNTAAEIDFFFEKLAVVRQILAQ